MGVSVRVLIIGVFTLHSLAPRGEALLDTGCLLFCRKFEQLHACAAPEEFWCLNIMKV